MNINLDRRAFIAATGATLTTALTPIEAQTAEISTQALDWGKLRQKRSNMLLGFQQSAYSTSQKTVYNNIKKLANTYINTAEKYPYNKGYIWNTPGGTSNITNTRISFERLLLLLRCYYTNIEGNNLYGNKKLKSTIKSGFEYLIDNRYNKSKEIIGNWWEWEIGIPLAILDLCILDYENRSVINELYREESIAAIKKFSITFSRYGLTGPGNIAWACHLYVLIGILTKDRGRINDAKKGIGRSIDIGNQDGYQFDGSYIDHAKFAYTGGYGLVHIQQIAQIAYLLYGSAAALQPSTLKKLAEIVYSSFQPLLFGGALMDMVRGRNISVTHISDREAGWRLLDSLAILSNALPQKDILKIRGIVKSQLGSSLNDYLKRCLNLFNYSNTHNCFSSRDIQPTNMLLGTRLYPKMARAVHRSEGFAFAISCMSRDIANYEYLGNKDYQINTKGAYTGLGMTYIYLKGDKEHFSDVYWPTVNSKRLPGTTIQSQLPIDTENHGKVGSGSTGGVRLGTSGLWAFHQYMSYSKLRVLKNWFMFDNIILAMGIIIDNDNTNVETIIDNRNIAQESATFTIKTTSESEPKSYKNLKGANNISWIHLMTSKYKSGYVLIEGNQAKLNAINDKRTGRWTDINNYPDITDTMEYKRDYASIYLDHGPKCIGQTYAYLILPGAELDYTKNISKNNPIKILSNNRKVQCAVHVTGINDSIQKLGAIFWSNDKVTIQGITSFNPVAMFIARTPGKIEISLADFSGVNGDLKLKINLEVYGQSYNDYDYDPRNTSSKITHTHNNDIVTLKFKAKNTSGITHKITFLKRST